MFKYPFQEQVNEKILIVLDFSDLIKARDRY